MRHSEGKVILAKGTASAKALWWNMLWVLEEHRAAFIESKEVRLRR